MKQETKNKIKKIAKIGGFVITFGFAVFGVLCAAMLMANASGKKDDFKTLGSSLVLNEVRSERNNNPKRQDTPVVYRLDEVALGGLGIDVNGGYKGFSSGISLNWSTYGLNPYTIYHIPVGYYRVSSTGSFSVFKNPSSGFSSDAWRTFKSAVLEKESPQVISSSWSDEPALVNLSEPVYEFYFYYSGSEEFYFNGSGNYIIELVDTLDLPVGSSISFSDSFSPLGLFGDSVTNNGGYVYLPNASGNVLSIEITGLIFKYGGVVYDGIHIECVRALSIGYINDDGQLVPQGGTEDYLWALSWIKFYQRYKGQGPQDGVVVVMPELKSVSGNAGPVAFTGRTQWVNRSDRTIQIIRDFGNATGRYDGRYSDMSDKQLLEWVSSSFSIGNALGVMGNNSVFDIFTNAFDSVLPILSIAILPNITLGMLLFIPLIGAIIVIIIRVVKK